ncbi:MAG: 50S ribosome-binding GTPase, partial [Ruaniaceae bacterium]|nr:50S ribosome-binding GTPase [Ruaniaceae bacterium]
TGSGKSSLFNSLTESTFADDGVIRPTTRRASSCSWGNEGDPILDFLGLDRGRRMTLPGAGSRSRPGDASGLVLLDLPDNDSVEEAHLRQVEQLLPVVDVLVWVVDPQKYADHLLHTKYLRVLRRRAEAMVVIVNQIDTLTSDGVRTIVQDVKRLLVEDGLPDVDVLTTCAISGEGVDELWTRLTGAVAGESTARRTIEAEISQIAATLLSYLGESEANVDDAVVEEVVLELLAASGVPAVADAIVAGRGEGMRPRAPGRAAVAAIGSSWAARATDGLPPAWADAVEEQLPSVRALHDSAMSTLEAVAVPAPRKGRARGFVSAGAVAAALAVGLIGLAVFGLLDPVNGPSGGPLAVVILGAVGVAVASVLLFVQVPRVVQDARESAAEEYREAVRGAVDENVRSVLVLPTAGVLARHARAREILESAEGR